MKNHKNIRHFAIRYPTSLFFLKKYQALRNTPSNATPTPSSMASKRGTVTKTLRTWSPWSQAIFFFFF